MRTRREFVQDVGVLVAGFFVGLGGAEAAGMKLPNITVYTEEGNATSLNAYYGKPRLLSCWGAFCAPCIEEIPMINEVSSSISVLGLYFMRRDSFAEDKASLYKIKKSHPMDFPNLLVPRSQQPRLYVSTVPTFFIIDAEGEIVYKQTGSLSYGSNYKQLKQNIAEGL